MNTSTRLDTVRAPRKAEAAARLRERAGALFGGPPEEPAATDGPATETPAATESPTAARTLPTPDALITPDAPAGPPLPGGRLGQLRQWLFVRCGLEFRTVLALTVVLAVAGGLAFHHYWTGRPRTVQVPVAARLPTPAARPAPFPSPSASPSRVTVDIAGKVARPGLRQLPKGARVADALTAAGGPLPGTDTTSLNLARQVTDGEQILVGVTPPPAATSADSAAAPGGPGNPGTPVSLNSATAAQLDALPGVGPVLAQHILDYRTQHGGFTDPQQLRQIPGIGPRKYATLQPLVHP
ncbi:helix-hairpin-helix domain-containing protein [Streptomyces sp. NBC_01476]|uniref:ComEA family DNA-binding protein n=1 Tax=Streptomyces sp. NBC_01476 TaxID=2903881 RepID=UPI002E30513E|nr:ComEA family DNA-binding protein [Streptomyces sp. NBC_01476]